MAPADLRAKFHCYDVHEATSGTCQTVQLRPVYNDSPENKKWSEATPSGSLHMAITNPAAFGFFAVGKDYFLDLSIVEAADLPVDLLPEGERIPKAGDDVKAIVGDTELSPTFTLGQTADAVQKLVPAAEPEHIEAAVSAHMDKVKEATDAGSPPVDTVVHTAAVEAATAAGASQGDAVTIAAAIPVAVAKLSDAAPQGDSGSGVEAVEDVKTEPDPAPAAVEDTAEEAAAKAAAADAVSKLADDSKAG